MKFDHGKEFTYTENLNRCSRVVLLEIRFPTIFFNESQELAKQIALTVRKFDSVPPVQLDNNDERLSILTHLLDAVPVG